MGPRKGHTVVSSWKSTPKTNEGRGIFSNKSSWASLTSLFGLQITKMVSIFKSKMVVIFFFFAKTVIGVDFEVLGVLIRKWHPFWNPKWWTRLSRKWLMTNCASFQKWLKFRQTSSLISKRSSEWENNKFIFLIIFIKKNIRQKIHCKWATVEIGRNCYNFIINNLLK